MSPWICILLICAAGSVGGVLTAVTGANTVFRDDYALGGRRSTFGTPTGGADLAALCPADHRMLTHVVALTAHVFIAIIPSPFNSVANPACRRRFATS